MRSAEAQAAPRRRMDSDGAGPQATQVSSGQVTAVRPLACGPPGSASPGLAPPGSAPPGSAEVSSGQVTAVRPLACGPPGSAPPGSRPLGSATDLVAELRRAAEGRPRISLATLLQAYLGLDRADRELVRWQVPRPELAWLDLLQHVAAPVAPDLCVHAVLALAMARRLHRDGDHAYALHCLERHLPLLRHIPAAWDLWCLLRQDRRGQAAP